MPDHVVLALLPGRFAAPSSANNVGVELDHCLACMVTRTVVRKGSPRKHEVDGRKSHVEIVIQVGEAGIEGVTDLLTLQGARGGVDGELGHDLSDINGALLALESLVTLDEVLYFFCNDGNVGSKGVLGEAELDKLELCQRSHRKRAQLDIPSSAPSTSSSGSRTPHPSQTPA